METEEEKLQEETLKKEHGVSTFEDLLELTGAWGTWNSFIFFIYGTAQIVVALHTVSYQFLGATPDHWCHIETLEQANWTQQQILSLAIPYSNSTNKYSGCQMYDYNYELAVRMGYDKAIGNRSSLGKGFVTCHSRDFNLTQYQSTVVTEFDLVCERRVLYSTTQSIVMAGNLVGYFLAGYFSDIWGRRFATLLNYLVLLVSAFLVMASTNEGIYIFIKFIINVATAGMYLSLFVFQIETCPTRLRSLLGALMKIPYAVGLMIVPGIAYLVRPWRMLHLAFAVPSLLGIILLVWLPESPRWLILQGRYKEALKVLKRASKVNKKPLSDDDQIMSAITIVGNQSVTEKKSGVLSTLQLGYKLVIDLFILPEFRLKSLVSIVCYLTSATVYYGMALAAEAIEADIYLYVFLAGLLEVPSYLLLWAMLSCCGRRTAQAVLFFFSAICLFLIMVLFLLEVSDVHWVIVTLSLTSKIATTAVNQLVWLYTAELYPTKYRSAAVGQMCTLGRIGTLCAPYINDIMGPKIVWGPSAVFGLMMLVSSAITMLLPETQHLNLTEDSKASVEKYELLEKDSMKNTHIIQRHTSVPNYSSIIRKEG